MNYGAIAIVFTLSFISCKKSGDSFKISGHIYSGCPSVVAQNLKVILYQEPDTANGILTGKILDTKFTDKTGLFSVSTGYLGVVSLRYEGGTVILGNINSNGASYNYLKIYKDYPTSIQLILNPLAAFTNLDTLYTSIPDVNGNPIKAAGPFFNGTLTTFAAYSHFSNIIRNDPSLNTHPTFTYHLNNEVVHTGTYTLVLCDTSTAKMVIP